MAISLLIPFAAVAAERSDTAAKELKEVVVKGRRQYAIDGGTVYIPTRNEKKAARNAQDLLNHIGITQIEVDPQTFSVKTLGGNDVQIFVNGIKASPETVWTMEVKRVEYLIAPADPKFQGAQFVINYIVDKYEYGGYTRLSLKEGFLTGYSSDAGLFSRFEYKKMTFDVFANASNNNAFRHSGSKVSEDYMLTGADGSAAKATREQSLMGYGGRSGHYPFTFSARYNSGRFSTTNSASFTFSEKDRNRQRGDVRILPDAGETTNSLRNTHNRSVSWYGDGFYWTDNGWFFAYNGNFSYDHNNVDYNYSNAYVGRIQTPAREDVFKYGLYLLTNKRVGIHQFGLTLKFNNINNRVVYGGTNPSKNSLSSPSASAQIRYNLSLPKFNLSVDVSPGWEREKVNSNVNSYFQITSHLQASYTPNSRNQFSLWMQLARIGSSGADNSESVLQLNELMYVSGNPNLRPPLNFDANLSYSWFPSGPLTLTAYGSAVVIDNRITADYTLYRDGTALLKSLTNSGRFFTGEIGVSLRLNLFNRRLRLSATPVQRFYRATGLNSCSYSPFAVKASANFYCGAFWAGVHYQTGDRMLGSQSGVKTKGRDYYQISAGWGNGSWNIYAGASNIFSRGWKETEQEYAGNLYSYTATSYGIRRHANIFVGASYTFGYGRKVDRSNEAAEQSGGKSAVINL